MLDSFSAVDDGDVSSCLTSSDSNTDVQHSTFSFLQACIVFFPMVLSEQDASSVIRAAAIHLRQNNNIPARCDGQRRRGGDSGVASRHRLKVERLRKNADIFIRSLFKMACESSGDAAASTCNKTPTPSKRFFKASPSVRRNIVIQNCQEKHLRLSETVNYWIK